MTQSNARRTTPVQASLPDLQQGLTLLEIDSSVGNALHALAVDHVLRSAGDARWIDPGTRAQTDPLVELAPSARILDRFVVARGFTPFQHLELFRTLPSTCLEAVELIVAPMLDIYYRDQSLLGDEGRDMLLSALALLSRVARRQEIPVLVTRATADRLSEPIVNAATQTIRCEATPFGPRYQTEGEDTLVYPVDGGQWIQTTLAFWEQVLAAREPLYDHGVEVAQPEVMAYGAN